MPDLKQTRNRLKMVMAALVVVDLAALVILFTPLGGSQAARQQQLAQLNQERKARAAAPWRGLDKKIAVAQQQIEQFYRDRFPAEDSTISAHPGKVPEERRRPVSSGKS